MLALEYLAQVEDDDPATAAVVHATLALVDEIRDVPNRVPPASVPLVWTQGWREVRTDQDLPKTAGTAIIAQDEDGSYRCWELLIAKDLRGECAHVWRTVDAPVLGRVLEDMVSSVKRIKLATSFMTSPPARGRRW
jgi:hypothetical protein